MKTPKDGGPAFPTTRMPDAPGAEGMSLRDYFAAAALQGLLAASHGDDAFCDTRTDPNTGLQTYRKTVYPLKNGHEDYSLDQIECPIRETATQIAARMAYEHADAMLKAREE